MLSTEYRRMVPGSTLRCWIKLSRENDSTWRVYSIEFADGTQMNLGIFDTYSTEEEALAAGEALLERCRNHEN